MSKIHVDRMAAAVKKYFAEAEIAQQKMKRNSEIYTAEFAEPENAKIKAELDRARWEAIDAIQTAQEAGRADAEKWGELRGDQLPDDAKLLQYDITPEQFAGLVERNRNNGTMSVLLRQYGDKLNKEAAAAGHVGMGPYDLSNLTTAEQKADVYDRFAMGARDLMNLIDNPGSFGCGTDSQMLKMAVDSFGTPSSYNQHLFDLL